MADKESLLPSESPVTVEPPVDIAEEKSVILPEATEKNPDDSKALAIVEKGLDSSIEEKAAEDCNNRAVILARVQTEKRESLVKAWEESEKSKAENKAYKNISAIDAWENSKKASIEAELKKIEEKLEKKKAECVEKLKNKAALIHKEAAEKKALIESQRGEAVLKAEELAAKHRANGTVPKKLLLGWF